MNALPLVLGGVLSVAVFVAVYALVPAGGARRELADPLLQQRLAMSNSVVTGFALRSADQLISRRSRLALAVRLSIAGLPFRPAEWRVLQIVVAFIAGAVAAGLGLPVAGAVLGVLTRFGTEVYLRRRESRARRRFEEDLPALLQLLSGSLRSGLSLSAALDVAVAEGREPMVGELKRVLARARLGEPVEAGFSEVAERMRSQDFEWVALAVRIQKEVGGNLAEILRTTADTVRERAYLKRQVRTLSAEGRLSAYVLLGLPFVAGGLIAMLNPAYVRPLWTTAPGLAMAAGAVVSMTIGWLWMRTMVRIEA